MVMVMPKRRINEPGLNYLQQEVTHSQRTAADLRQEIETLRSDRSMLINILEEISSDDSIWVDTVETKTMRFRLNNLVNNIKSG